MTYHGLGPVVCIAMRVVMFKDVVDGTGNRKGGEGDQRSDHDLLRLTQC